MTHEKDLAGLGARGGVHAIREDRSKRGARAVAPSPTVSRSVFNEIVDLEAGSKVGSDEEAEIVADALQGRRELDRGDHAEVAGLLASAMEKRSKAPLVFDRDALWRYQPDAGRWGTVDKEQVTRLVGRFAGTPIRTSEGEKQGAKEFKGTAPNAEGVCKYLRSHPREGCGPGFFDDAPAGVAVANGFLTIDAERIELRTHEWDHRVRDRVTIGFDENAAAPAWRRALEEWFEGDSDATEKIAFLQEFVGACLFGLATRYQRCAVLLGEGANGKSVFIEVVSELFPKGGVTAIPPHDFESERMGAGLDRSRLNAVTEVPAKAILASEGFKAAVSGDAMTRRRAYKDEITFKPRAGHLFAANRLPVVSDTSEGFWRRLLLVSFNRKFEGEQRDNTLAERIRRDELPGVLAWAVEGVGRLIRQGGYTEPQSTKRELAEWRRESNPVELWLEACCEREGWTNATALYQHYQRWATDNGFKPCLIREFGQRLKPILGHRKNSKNEYAARIRYP